MDWEEDWGALNRTFGGGPEDIVHRRQFPLEFTSTELKEMKTVTFQVKTAAQSIVDCLEVPTIYHMSFVG